MNAQRLEAVRKRLEALRLDALIVTFLPNIRYLTGFSGSNGLCLVSHKQQVFVSDGRYKTQSAEEVKDFRVLIAKGNLFEELEKKNLLSSRARVGIEVHHLSVAELENLKKFFPRVKFISTSAIVESIAAVKDEFELTQIKQAVAITDQVFDKILGVLNEGMSELEVAAEIVYLHRTLGAEADAFEPIVASGVRGSLPHARATSKKIRKGEFVTLDFGCRYRGYHSDLTRTVSVGAPSEEAKNIYGVVRDAQQQAIDAAKSGMKAKKLDGVARKRIREAGYGKFFTHSLGHGMGMQVHETPRVSALSNDILQSGNVITIEPGIYVPGLGGVRIEDDVIIRDDRCEVLTTGSRDLIIL